MDTQYGTVKRFFELMNTIERIKDLTIIIFTKINPEIPGSVYEPVFTKEHLDRLEKLLIPIYLKNYTEEDILNMIDFFESDTGKKMLKVSAKVIESEYKVGEIWMKEMQNDIMKVIDNYMNKEWNTMNKEWDTKEIK